MAGNTFATPDTITWVEHDATSLINSWAIAYSPTLRSFAAVSFNGDSRVLTSSNGINWFAVVKGDAPGQYPKGWRDIVWGGNAYAAVGDYGILISFNGRLWTKADVPAHNYTSVTYSAQLDCFIAMATNGVCVKFSVSPSTGLIASSHTIPLGHWSSVTYSDELGKFLAVSYGGDTPSITSDDGETWVTGTLSKNLWTKVIWVPSQNKFYAISNTSNNNLQSSTTGTSWESISTVGGFWRDLVWVPSLNMLAMVSSATEVNTGTITNGAPAIGYKTRRLASISWSDDSGTFVAQIVNNAGDPEYNVLVGNVTTLTPTPTITISPTISATPLLTPTVTPTITPTISVTVSIAPSASQLTPSPTPSPTGTPTGTPTPTPTMTPHDCAFDASSLIGWTTSGVIMAEDPLDPSKQVFSTTPGTYAYINCEQPFDISTEVSADVYMASRNSVADLLLGCAPDGHGIMARIDSRNSSTIQQQRYFSGFLQNYTWTSWEMSADPTNGYQYAFQPGEWHTVTIKVHELTNDGIILDMYVDDMFAARSSLLQQFGNYVGINGDANPGSVAYFRNFRITRNLFITPTPTPTVTKTITPTPTVTPSTSATNPYAELSTTIKSPDIILTDGNTVATADTNTSNYSKYNSVLGTKPMVGKKYWEATINSLYIYSGTQHGVGLATSDFILKSDSTYAGSTDTSVALWPPAGAVYLGGSVVASLPTTYNSIKTYTFAYDADTKSLWIGDTVVGWYTGDPATATAPTVSLASITDVLYPIITLNSETYNSVVINFGKNGFTAPVPTGFSRL